MSARGRPKTTSGGTLQPGPPVNPAGRWLRRARPLLGTLVEVGVRPETADPLGCIEAAFEAVRCVEAQLSRFEPGSDVGRFGALAVGGSLRMRPATRCVLEAARDLARWTDGLFDVTLGSAPRGWALDGDRLCKVDAAASLDLGGIGKGHAVDCAVQALQAAGCEAGSVNAGGDLRVFGDLDLPVRLRDEATGGVRRFLSLGQGAFATSHFGPTTRSRLAGPATAAARHVSVAAPTCLWADALTKVVAASGDAGHPALARYDAVGWIH